MIESFRGQWTRLSNYSLVSVWFEGHIYSSVEHAYQAAKTLDEDARRVIRSAATPNIAKKLGRKVKIRGDWELVKLKIMEELLREKFAQLPERSVLESTGYKDLIEGNWWGDTFWGQCPVGNGENHLGLLLMKIRTEMQEGRF